MKDKPTDIVELRLGNGTTVHVTRGWLNGVFADGTFKIRRRRVDRKAQPDMGRENTAH